MMTKPCACGGDHYAKGKCKKCYERDKHRENKEYHNNKSKKRYGHIKDRREYLKSISPEKLIRIVQRKN